MSTEQPVAGSAYEGSCHCGAISYVYRTAVPVSRWQVRACQCSFCRTHAALTASDPAGSVEFRFACPEELHLYRFGLKITDFLLCRNCGTYIAARITTPKGIYAVVNLRALRSVPPELPAAEAVVYDAETPDSRIDRRVMRWTPVVGAAVRPV